VLTQNKVNNPTAPAEDYTINNAAAENDGIITYTVTNNIGQTKTGTINVLVGTPQYNSFFDVYVQTDWTDGTAVIDGTNP
jgi:Flp pilus assembly protein TadG